MTFSNHALRSSWRGSAASITPGCTGWPKDKFLALPEDAARVDASYGSGLKLAGAKAGPLQPDAAKPGWLLPLTLYWQVERPGVKDLSTCLEMGRRHSKVWLTRENYPAWGPENGEEATSSWRGDLIFPDDHILDIGPDIPRVVSPGGHDRASARLSGNCCLPVRILPSAWAGLRYRHADRHNSKLCPARSLRKAA